jgi:hypothetical protein
MVGINAKSLPGRHANFPACNNLALIKVEIVWSVVVLVRSAYTISVVIAPRVLWFMQE